MSAMPPLASAKFAGPPSVDSAPGESSSPAVSISSIPSSSDKRDTSSSFGCSEAS